MKSRQIFVIKVLFSFFIWNLETQLWEFLGVLALKIGHKTLQMFIWIVPDGNLYCKMCYTRNFGPQTRSASDIEHKIIDTSVIKADDPKRNCPRYVKHFEI